MDNIQPEEMEETAEALIEFAAIDEAEGGNPHVIATERFAAQLLIHAAKQLRAHNSDSAEPVAYLTPYFESDRSGKLVPVVVYAETNGSINADYKPLYLASHPAKEVERRIKAFEEALTPSAETKAEYIGEFQFTVTMMELDDSDEPFEVQNMVTVPWTTIKEIMQAIRSRALTNRTPDDEVGNG